MGHIWSHKSIHMPMLDEGYVFLALAKSAQAQKAAKAVDDELLLAPTRKEGKHKVNACVTLN